MEWTLGWWNSYTQWLIIPLVSFVAGWLFHKVLNREGKSNEIANNTSQANLIRQEADESKMILIVRTDLKMGKGKIAAQCCHAAVSLYDMILDEKGSHGDKWRTQLKQWEASGAKKVITAVSKEADLNEVYESVPYKKVPKLLIQDAGLTQIEAGSKTVLGIGPAPSSVLDEYVHHLKLLP
eukprot:TRINITY_DN4532_c0_g2_i2.p1 TRINITY_DN4532_c0_g2~~TRINITY_DN4532_c0_g2_i2.p1  ORF type:complete len:181 (-),score=20.40 TRINITY_DN4532_c0_g2_i2:111-653(-)